MAKQRDVADLEKKLEERRQRRLKRMTPIDAVMAVRGCGRAEAESIVNRIGSNAAGKLLAMYRDPKAESPGKVAEFLSVSLAGPKPRIDNANGSQRPPTQPAGDEKPAE